ncbi:uncharacterized protein LOC121793809 isoform X1 [Salvia splendens]|uniref:uncharacterized protein LOC121793809 isoform X1 n=1 Tax=Salvia splendens TaxID=180675 RepID=UPI001C26FE80|nr:uncharacterized protein LOC121793809 isoform X1 [Salvia splendens]XP_042047781.1 uncharacterized protein LOC121793809 isoform X1 [Salvia splendens]
MPETCVQISVDHLFAFHAIELISFVLLLILLSYTSASVVKILCCTLFWFTKSEAKDIQINMAISTVFEEGGGDERRVLRMVKRLLRSLSLVFGCLAFASLGYTGVLNVIEYAAGFVPVFLYNNQELLVTASLALMLYILASHYR